MSVAKKIENVYKRIISNIDIRLESCKRLNVKDDKNKLVVLNTAINSDNLGDEILMHYVMRAISKYLSGYEVIYIPTHCAPTEEQINEMLSAKSVLICGTNILSPQMELYSGWKFDKRLIHLNNVILCGVGWWGYKAPSMYSKFVYRRILSKTCIQATRDDFTSARLKELGVDTINTNCLTMWELDKICLEIPEEKSDKVVFTLTSVYSDIEHDLQLIYILKKNYKHIYFWPQGDEDLHYFNRLYREEDIEVIDRTLQAYSDVLSHSDIDYVGSRLHGGIHALHYKHRAIILVVDNRAREMGKDTGLPIIEMTEIEEKLDSLINSNWKTIIVLNKSEQNKWLDSLSNELHR